ncbi:B12-binding domain-containing radical SAM protein [Candidatus Omnitrophota bacterium]
MQITFVNSNFREQIIPNFIIDFASGLLSLGAVLEKNNYKVKIINLFQLSGIPQLTDDASFCSNAGRIIVRQGADILGFNSRCDTYPIVLNIARQCKQLNPQSIILIGGPQATATDYDTLKNFPFVDIIVRGEGESTLLDLMHCLKKKRDPGNVAGITYRKNGNIIRNKPRELIKNLNTLPLPAYHLIEEYLPNSEELKDGWAYISIGRGCPHKCTFCSTGMFWQRRYRIRSPENILKEIIFLKKNYKINRFYLGHDNFLTNTKDIERICNILLGKKINIEWSCSSRVDSIDKGLFEVMSRSGCKRIFFGIESGSSKIQKSIKKKIDVSLIPKAIQECRKYNIFAILSFIIGFPNENKEDLNETLKLALNSRLFENCYSHIRLLTPIAGTEIFIKNKRKLYLKESWADLYLIGNLIKKTIWSKSLIKKYPLIFSSFYCIKLKYLPEQLTYQAFIIFSVLICVYPISSRIALQDLKFTPLILIDEFSNWLQDRMNLKGQNNLPNSKEIIKTFPAFLKESYQQRHNNNLFVALQRILNYEYKTMTAATGKK